LLRLPRSRARRRRGRGAHAHRGRLPRAGYSPRPLRRPAGQGGAPCRALPPTSAFPPPRVWRDYIYAAEDLRDFAGRRYSGQRNHINKFRKLYPDAAFRPLGKSDLPLITQFFRDYEAVFTKASDSAKNELRCAVKNAPHDRQPALPRRRHGAGRQAPLRRHGGALLDTLQIHIEKALYGYEGVYPATVQAFAQEFAVDGVRWLNREDDAGDKGLRTSKLQYLPDHLGAKLRFDVLNELVNITEIPTLTTARLTLDSLTDADKPPTPPSVLTTTATAGGATTSARTTTARPTRTTSSPSRGRTTPAPAP